MSRRAYLPRTWTDPRQELRASPTAGIGAFASAPIGAGEPVEIVGGRLMDEEQFRAFQATAARFNAIQIDEDLHLVEEPEITAARGGSLNHSCDANLWLADEVTIVARRPIAAGEELTVDYALFTTDPGWALERPCACGAPDCRGRVTGEDWRLAAVRTRYAGHFSPFINRRIERDGD